MNYKDLYYDEETGRILTDAEYAEMLKQRPDVFVIERERRTTAIQTACMFLVLVACLFMMTHTVVDLVSADFMEKKLVERSATILDGDKMAEILKEQRKEDIKVEEVKAEQRKLTAQKNTSTGGDGGAGRRDVVGIGYGVGYGSGLGGGGGGSVEDLLGSLMRGEVKMVKPDFEKGGALSGGRSRLSIQRVVMQNMAALRHAYNKRLRDKPGDVTEVIYPFVFSQ
jgi:hypothetical protein